MWGLSSPTGDWTCSPYPGRWNPNHWTSRGVPRAESSETLTTERFVICEVMWKSLSCVWLFTTPWTIWSMEFSRPEYWSGYPFSSPGDLPNPGTEPRAPALQAAEPYGKPKHTGVGSLFLLQRIFPTQESNRGLLHCRQILYQLSYQGSPAKSFRITANGIISFCLMGE